MLERKASHFGFPTCRGPTTLLARWTEGMTKGPKHAKTMRIHPKKGARKKGGTWWNVSNLLVVERMLLWALEGASEHQGGRTAPP